MKKLILFVEGLLIGMLEKCAEKFTTLGPDRLVDILFKLEQVRMLRWSNDLLEGFGPQLKSLGTVFRSVIHAELAAKSVREKDPAQALLGQWLVAPDDATAQQLAAQFTAALQTWAQERITKGRAKGLDCTTLVRLYPVEGLTRWEGELEDGTLLDFRIFKEEGTSVVYRQAETPEPLFTGHIYIGTLSSVEDTVFVQLRNCFPELDFPKTVTPVAERGRPQFPAGTQCDHQPRQGN